MINKMSKILDRLTKKLKTQMIEIKNEREDKLLTKSGEKIIRKHYKQLYANNWDNLDEKKQSFRKSLPTKTYSRRNRKYE